MARTVVAIFNTIQDANDAVRELVDNNIPRDHISLIANNPQGNNAVNASRKATAEGAIAGETGAGAGMGARIGAAIGGIGGLLVGLGALTIPGIGPVIASGPIVVALTTLTGAGVGAVAGGVTGSLLGALIGLGVPEDEAETFAEGVRRGGILLTVQTDHTKAEQVTGILNRHKPMDIHSQIARWPNQARPRHNPNTSNDLQFNPVNEGFHNHYITYLAGSGYPFEDYLPAYGYGYIMRTNPSYKGQDWRRAESELKQGWERRYPGTWVRFKPAIRHAWENHPRIV